MVIYSLDFSYISRFLKHLEEEVMNNDSPIWKEDIPLTKLNALNTTPSPVANNTRCLIIVVISGYKTFVCQEHFFEQFLDSPA